MSGEDRGLPSAGGPRRPSRWRDRDWWFGRTPEQRARKEAAWKEFRQARTEARDAWRSRPGSDRARSAEGAASGAGSSQGVLAIIGGLGRVLTIFVTLPFIAGLFFGPIGVLVALVLILALAPRSRGRAT